MAVPTRSSMLCAFTTKQDNAIINIRMSFFIYLPLVFTKLQIFSEIRVMNALKILRGHWPWRCSSRGFLCKRSAKTISSKFYHSTQHISRCAAYIPLPTTHRFQSVRLPSPRQENINSATANLRRKPSPPTAPCRSLCAVPQGYKNNRLPDNFESPR